MFRLAFCIGLLLLKCFSLRLESINVNDGSETVLESSKTILKAILQGKASTKFDQIETDSSYLTRNIKKVDTSQLLEFVVNNIKHKDIKKDEIDAALKRDSINFMELLQRLMNKLNQSKFGIEKVSINFLNYLKFYLREISHDNQSKIDSDSVERILSFLNKLKDFKLKNVGKNSDIKNEGKARHGHLDANVLDENIIQNINLNKQANIKSTKKEFHKPTVQIVPEDVKEEDEN